MSSLHYLEKSLSTNDEIESFLLYSSENCLGVYTFNQTQGRGQYGNVWKISPNLNIAISIGIKADTFTINDFLFNYYTANNIRDFLANLTEKEVKTKWPNDIIVANKKIAGILIEKKKINDSFYFIIGIGLNVLQTEFMDFSNAGSLLTQTSKHFDLHETAKKLYVFLTESLLKTPTEAEIIEAYNKHLFRKGQISVFEKDGKQQNGIIIKADENGELWIDLENEGLQKFYYKEIKLLY